MGGNQTPLLVLLVLKVTFPLLTTDSNKYCTALSNENGTVYSLDRLLCIKTSSEPPRLALTRRVLAEIEGGTVLDHALKHV